MRRNWKFLDFAKGYLTKGLMLLVLGLVASILALIIVNADGGDYVDQKNQYQILMILSGESVEDENLNKTADLIREIILNEDPAERLKAMSDLRDGKYFDLFVENGSEILEVINHKKTAGEIVDLSKAHQQEINYLVMLGVMSLFLFCIGSFAQLVKPEFHGGEPIAPSRRMRDWPIDKWWFWLIALFWLATGFWLFILIWFVYRTIFKEIAY
jgi:hypothetical protein